MAVAFAACLRAMWEAAAYSRQTETLVRRIWLVGVKMVPIVRVEGEKKVAQGPGTVGALPLGCSFSRTSCAKMDKAAARVAAFWTRSRGKPLILTG